MMNPTQNQSTNRHSDPEVHLLIAPPWKDYELIDSGNGLKLERYGPYTFVRPAPQAIWRPALADAAWNEAYATFQPIQAESGGQWRFKKQLKAPTWTMSFGNLRFNAFTSGSRHMGVFPEQASQWTWISETISAAKRPLRVLNLFGYTGLATLAAAEAGAQVTHVDASKKTVTLARENQALSELSQKPIRWIVDDALKFVRREARRQAQYDGIILDPPKFGRGPKGEVWEFFDLLPALLQDCYAILNPHPLFIVLTAYAIQASAISLAYPMQTMMATQRGKTEVGELAIRESSAGRLLSVAIYARWRAE